MLNLYKLEVFNAVAIEGSFSKAAERLLLSQPAVSQHIRDLEVNLQATLFYRGSRGVRLTAAGETLLDYTRCILRLLGEAEDAIIHQKVLENASLAIGATPGAGINLLPVWIQAFQGRYPAAKISLRTDTTNVIVGEIISGRLEIGFIEGELIAAPPIHSLALREIEMFIMTGPNHPWSGKKTIPATALQNAPFITRPSGSHTRTWIDRIFEQYGISPEIIAEFDRPEAIIAAVSAGMGITILPDWGVLSGSEQQLKRLTLEEGPLRRILKLVWSEDNPLRPPVKAFLALLIEEFPQLSGMEIVSSSMDSQMPQIANYRASLRCGQENT